VVLSQNLEAMAARTDGSEVDVIFGKVRSTPGLLAQEENAVQPYEDAIVDA
jgi:hypothetical protein